MPRKYRIDAAGALHHVIVRGIDRAVIFHDDGDREEFLRRFSMTLHDTEGLCYAWALMTNHVHLLIRTGSAPTATVMRRLLTGYAQHFNRRHHRTGHLFQNRYKSILCQEEPYLLELVRYIHLNPLRAGLVADLTALDHYRYAGHGVLMGKVEMPWQACDAILALFGERLSVARRRYRQYVERGIAQGRRDDLIGGGIVRSAGGWSAIRGLRKTGAQVKGDEQILGDSAFVARVLREADEHLESGLALKAQGYDRERLKQRVGEVLGVDPGIVHMRGKDRQAVKARSLYCYWAIRELGENGMVLAEELGLSQPAVSVAVKRGACLVKEHGFMILSSASK